MQHLNNEAIRTLIEMVVNTHLQELSNASGYVFFLMRQLYPLGM